MSEEKTWVDKEHYRVVSEDKERSWLYKVDSDLFSSPTCVEIADHHKDGTTTAYEPDGSILGSLFSISGKGKEK